MPMRHVVAVCLGAAVCGLAPATPRPWRPYLDAGPLKSSECVLRFVNVPAAAIDASAAPSGDCFGIWRRAGEVVIVTGRTFPVLKVAQSAGVLFPRGKLKAPYHQDTMSTCCAIEVEDPSWLDPEGPFFEAQQAKGGGRPGWRPARACDVDGDGGRVNPPPGMDEMVVDFAMQAAVLEEGFTDPQKRFEGDWEADFVGGTGGGQQYQKRRTVVAAAGLRGEDSGFDATGDLAPWDVVQ